MRGRYGKRSRIRRGAVVRNSAGRCLSVRGKHRSNALPGDTSDSSGPAPAGPRNVPERIGTGRKRAVRRVRRRPVCGAAGMPDVSIICEKALFFGINPYLCGRFGLLPPSGGGVKRESGANPGQSRCCEAPRSFRTSRPLILSDPGGFGKGGSPKNRQGGSVPGDPVGWANGFG